MSLECLRFWGSQKNVRVRATDLDPGRERGMRAVTDVGGTFIIEHWSGTFRVGPGKADPRQDHETQRALFSLRHGFSNHQRAVVEKIEWWYRGRSGGGFGNGTAFGNGGGFGNGAAFPPWVGNAFGVASSVAAWERTRMHAWEAFEAAVRAGALCLTRIEHQPVFVTPVEQPHLQKLESRREEDPSHFEATIVDEVGQPIAGLEMVLSCEGQNYDLVTNGAGQVRQDGVMASRASLRVKSTQQLRDIVTPRWATPRSGAFPRAKNLLRAELGDNIESFSLAAKDEHLIVITPALAPLHVEWWDGRGKHRHALCRYQVTGPRSFSGTTDENGQLLHPDVPLGDYTIEITVEYFRGRSYARTLTFEEEVTLTKGSGLEVLRVGPTPEVAFRRTRGYLFDQNKSFLMPRAAKQLLELPTWWKNRAPSQLLIVGHTDVTGKQGANDVLSQARADAVKAFIEQDVDAWLAFYDEQGATKWGSREDRLMIRSLPDFATRLTEGDTLGHGGASENGVFENGAPENGAHAQGETSSDGVTSANDARAAGEANGARSSNGNNGEEPSSAATSSVGASGTSTGSSTGAKPRASSNKPTPKKPQVRRQETIVEWFQRTRGLEVDGVAGPQTRRALISEYMGVGTVTLRETPGYPVSIATFGEGEDYPLAETRLPLDVQVSRGGSGSGADNGGQSDGGAAHSGAAENALDRRVELFFFDTDFGILPPVGDVGGPEYIDWRKRAEEESDVAVEREVQEAKYLAVRNAQFRSASAVMLPEGDAPSTGGNAPLTSVGLLATALRYNEEHPGYTILVAGHTDSVGGEKDNDQLSEQRAQLVHAVLTGGAAGRSTFQDLADETGTVSDWKQILKWASLAFPSVEELVEEGTEDDIAAASDAAASDAAASDEAASDEAASDEQPTEGALGTGFDACDPGEIDDDETTAVAAVKGFQTAYNENYKLLGGSGQITVDGEVGKQTWGAIYDLYQYNLAQELGETFDGLKELQGLVQLLPTSKPYVGFGESAPADGTYENDAEEQPNRRVEVLFFAYGHEPEVAVLDEDPHVSELYHGEVFTRVEIPGRPGGAKAHWTVLVACPDGEDRSLVLENEAGTYCERQTGALMTFRDVPQGSLLRLSEADAAVSMAKQHLSRWTVPVSQLRPAVAAGPQTKPLALNFITYPLERITHGT